MILFFRLLAWSSTFAVPHMVWLVVAGLLSMFLFLIVVIVGIFLTYDRSRSKH